MSDDGAAPGRAAEESARRSGGRPAEDYAEDPDDPSAEIGGSERSSPPDPSAETGGPEPADAPDPSAEGGGPEPSDAPAPSSEAGDARVTAAIDLRAILVRSAGYALIAAWVAFGIHGVGTLRGLGEPGVGAAVLADLGRAAGTFAVSYPVVIGINTAGRRLGATRLVAARTRAPWRVYAAATVAVTLLLFLPVIGAIIAGTPY